MLSQLQLYAALHSPSALPLTPSRGGMIVIYILFCKIIYIKNVFNSVDKLTPEMRTPCLSGHSSQVPDCRASTVQPSASSVDIMLTTHKVMTWKVESGLKLDTVSNCSKGHCNFPHLHFSTSITRHLLVLVYDYVQKWSQPMSPATIQIRDERPF